MFTNNSTNLNLKLRLVISVLARKEAEKFMLIHNSITVNLRSDISMLARNEVKTVS